MADYVSVSVAIKANDEALGKMRDVLEKMVSPEARDRVVAQRA